MRILAIETSCDETAVALLECEGDVTSPSFHVLGDALLSQAEIHAAFGGVYPNLAKREHSRNLVPLLEQALTEAKMLEPESCDISYGSEIKTILEREPELYEQLVSFLKTNKHPDIDIIAVTEGPGLEPALWVGINFARSLSLAWNIPVQPVNHMEGHIFSSLLMEEEVSGAGGQGSETAEPKTYNLKPTTFPLLALLISGGHTELVLSEDWFEYKLVGATRDDAVGEAFDKVARMLSLSYPGGPEIARLAREARVHDKKSRYSLPRPMLTSDDCDFSFSGLKTAVLYSLRDAGQVSEEIKQEFAREFEDAVVEILIVKTRRALLQHSAQTLILGGGVSANEEIRTAFKALMETEFPDALLYIPPRALTTDNAVMIGVAGFLRAQNGIQAGRELKAQGNLKLSA